MRTTIGQLLVNRALPEKYRDFERVWDKATTREVLSRLAQEDPEEYRETLSKLGNVGREVAYATGGNSFGLKHLAKSKAGARIRDEIKRDVYKILADDSLTDDERDAAIIKATGKHFKRQQEEIYQESLENENPLAYQVLSGSRGNKANLASLLGGDLLYVDHRERVLPVPITSSYSEGLTPAEYWAGLYGARKGIVDTKFCVFAEELVLMADYSEKPIKLVRPGDWVMGADRQGRMFPVRVKQRYDNGPRVCYRYRFRKGQCRNEESFRYLVATEDHKILAQVKAGRPGAIYARRSIYEPTPLPLGSARLQKNPTKNEFVAYPSRGETGCLDRVDEPRALLAGLMLGDGCMAPSKHGNYSFSCADPVLLRDVTDYLAEFNLRLSQYGKENGGYGHGLVEIKPTKRLVRRAGKHNCFVSGHLNPAKAWLKWFLGEALAHEKIMPPEVWGWNDQSVGDFLGGLFSTDGCVEARARGCSIRLTMTSLDVVAEAQRLLELRLGIWTSSLSLIPKEKIENGVHDQYCFSISHPECARRFADRVPLVGCKRQELAEALRYRSTDPASQEIGFKLIGKELLGLRETCDLEVDHPDHLFVLANGLIASNSTRDSGYLSKQMNQIVHRAVVSALDHDKEPEGVRGLPVSISDEDNEGALLAQPVGGFPRNTVLTPKILDRLREQGVKRLLVRSPAVGGAKDGRVVARDVGVREFGRLPVAGEFVGLTAAQAVTEKLSQAQLSSKHSSGVAGMAKGVSGFKAINALLQAPKHVKGGAAHALVDGLVQRVEPAPAGGSYVWIENKPHFVADGFDVGVKKGDHVEAGDVISEGLPNMSVVVEHKGVGEGRRYFVEAARKAFKDADLKANRRNLELVAAGLVNHVRLAEEVGDYSPDDVVGYGAIESSWAPRKGSRKYAPKSAIGKHLERPYLHYAIGDRVRPRMVKELEEFGVKEIEAHDDPPPFAPEMIRAAASIQHDPDWMTRMYGAGQKGGVMSAIHRGGVSDAENGSFVPALARGAGFGLTGDLQTPRDPSLGSLGPRTSVPASIPMDRLLKLSRAAREALDAKSR